MKTELASLLGGLAFLEFENGEWQMRRLTSRERKILAGCGMFAILTLLGFGIFNASVLSHPEHTSDDVAMFWMFWVSLSTVVCLFVIGIMDEFRR